MNTSEGQERSSSHRGATRSSRSLVLGGRSIKIELTDKGWLLMKVNGTYTKTLLGNPRYGDRQVKGFTAFCLKHLNVVDKDATTLTKQIKELVGGEETRDTPKRGEAWQSSTWGLVKECKASPKFAGKTALEAMNTVPWDSLSFNEEEKIQFMVEWDKVKVASGHKPLDWALDMSRKKPLMMSSSPIYNAFISLVGWLQIAVIDKPTDAKRPIEQTEPIYIPCHLFGQVLGCPPITVSRMIQSAIKGGFITMEKIHSSNKSTRFSVNTKKLPMLNLEEKTSSSVPSEEAVFLGPAIVLPSVQETDPSVADVNLLGGFYYGGIWPHQK